MPFFMIQQVSSMYLFQSSGFAPRSCTLPSSSRAFLLACICETYRGKCELSSKIHTLQSQLQSELETEDYQKVTTLSYAAAENTQAKTKLLQTKKLERLMNRWNKHRELCPQGLERWVVNLTDRTLSEPQENVLRLRLNFATAPTKFPLVDTIAAVEEGARQWNEKMQRISGDMCVES